MMCRFNHLMFALMALLAAPLVLAAAGTEAYAGKFQWKESPEARAALEKAVDAGAQQVTWALRKIARGRLTETTKPYVSISMTIKADQIVFERNGTNPITARTDGKAVKWKREDGKEYLVAFAVEADGVLKQTFTADDGVRENRFTLSPDGRILTMQASVSSKKLRQPVVFSLEYMREPAAPEKPAVEKHP
jgi:hypothetical protein